MSNKYFEINFANTLDKLNELIYNGGIKSKDENCLIKFDEQTQDKIKITQELCKLAGRAINRINLLIEQNEPPEEFSMKWDEEISFNFLDYLINDELFDENDHVEPGSYDPDYAVKPGETIIETLIHNFAESVKKDGYELEGLINGDIQIDEEWAEVLENSFNINKQLWLNREKSYRENSKKLEEKKKLKDNTIENPKQKPIRLKTEHDIETLIEGETKTVFAFCETKLEKFDKVAKKLGYKITRGFNPSLPHGVPETILRKNGVEKTFILKEKTNGCK